VISHWDKAKTERGDLGHIGGGWTDLDYPRKNGLWFKRAGVMIAADHIPLLDE